MRVASATLLFLAIVLNGCSTPKEVATTMDLLADPGQIDVTVSPGTSAAALGRNVPTDMSWTFEAGEEDYWQLRTNRGQARGEVTRQIAHGGQRSYCIEAVGGTADTDAEVDVAVRPATQYRLEGYLQAIGLDPSDATIYGTLYLGEFPHAQKSGRREDPLEWHRNLPMLRGTSHGWQHIDYTFRTTAVTHVLRVAASLGSWGAAGGKICFDDLRLTQVRDGSGPAAGHKVAPVIQDVAVGGKLRRALLARPRSEFRYDLTVPAGARLRFATGVATHGWSATTDGALFKVEVRVNRKAEPIFSRNVVPGDRAAHQRWEDADVPLTAYAGRRVQLVFRTGPSPSDAPQEGFFAEAAAWANPIVYVPRKEQDRRHEPDIFLITVDTLRSDHLGCYGYARDTSPAIDGLAADGVLFENTLTTIPRTTPALASLMTGLYPRSHGLMTLLHTLSDEQTTLAEYLQRLGYTTGAVVTDNVAPETGLQQGFETYDDHHKIWINSAAARAGHLVPEAIDWISQRMGLKMFLWLHVWDPHFRYMPPPPYDTYFDRDYRGAFDLYHRLDRGEITMGQVHFHCDLTPRQLEHAVALYDGEIRYTDQVIAGFLRKLKEWGLYDDALIVFASDHGESLGEHGYFFDHGDYLYDETLRIPLIIKFPHNRNKGLHISGKTMILDVLPTVLSVAGAHSLPAVAGKDLVLFLDGRKEPHPESYAETGRVFFRENPRRYVEGIAGNWKSVREGGWKLIQIPTPDKDLYELYNTASDPKETKNLYRPDDPTAQHLIGQLQNWVAGFQNQRAPISSTSTHIEPEAADRLRSLGYLNK
jgi:arylsulfatase A-like enzyme